MLDRDIFVNMFACNEEINRFMRCADLADGGMKVFGAFQSGKITFNGEQTKGVRKTTLAKRAIRALLMTPSVYYAQADKYFAFKDPYVKMFSVNGKFLVVSDLERKLEQDGLTKIDITKVSV